MLGRHRDAGDVGPDGGDGNGSVRLAIVHLVFATLLASRAATDDDTAARTRRLPACSRIRNHARARTRARIVYGRREQRDQEQPVAAGAPGPSTSRVGVLKKIDGLEKQRGEGDEHDEEERESGRDEAREVDG